MYFHITPGMRKRNTTVVELCSCEKHSFKINCNIRYVLLLGRVSIKITRFLSHHPQFKVNQYLKHLIKYDKLVYLISILL